MHLRRGLGPRLLYEAFSFIISTLLGGGGSYFHLMAFWGQTQSDVFAAEGTRWGHALAEAAVPVGECGPCPSFWVISWHSPYNWGKITKKNHSQDRRKVPAGHDSSTCFLIPSISELRNTFQVRCLRQLPTQKGYDKVSMKRSTEAVIKKKTELLRVPKASNGPTNKPKWLTKGGDLREEQVHIPWSVWPFLRVTALLFLLTDTQTLTWVWLTLTGNRSTVKNCAENNGEKHGWSLDWKKTSVTCTGTCDIGSYCLVTEQECYRLCAKDIERMAYSLAIRNGERPPFSRANEALGGKSHILCYEDILICHSFVCCNNLRLQSRECYSF